MQFGLHSLSFMVIQLIASVLSVTMPSATVMAAVTSLLFALVLVSVIRVHVNACFM